MQLHTTFMFVVVASASLVLIFYFMSGARGHDHDDYRDHDSEFLYGNAVTTITVTTILNFSMGMQ